jgi:hypothetical protein
MRLSPVRKRNRPLFLEEVSDELRQGDVCFDWVFPKWQLNEYQVASDASSGATNRAIIHVLASGASLPIMVLSHDCEIENPRTRIGLSVAPILPWPFGDHGSDESLDLMRSGSLSADSTYDFIQFFPVQLKEAEGAEPSWKVVDFSGLMSASPARKVIPLLKARKKLEMLEETRKDLKLKLAAFFGRE